MNETDEDTRNEFELACPKCGKGDGISIQISVWVDVCHDHTEYEGGDHEWDHDSNAICDCGFEGVVSDFETEEEE